MRGVAEGGRGKEGFVPGGEGFGSGRNEDDVIPEAAAREKTADGEGHRPEDNDGDQEGGCGATEFGIVLRGDGDPESLAGEDEGDDDEESSRDAEDTEAGEDEEFNGEESHSEEEEDDFEPSCGSAEEATPEEEGEADECPDGEESGGDMGLHVDADDAEEEERSGDQRVVECEDESIDEHGGERGEFFLNGDLEALFEFVEILDGGLGELEFVGAAAGDGEDHVGFGFGDERPLVPAVGFLNYFKIAEVGDFAGFAIGAFEDFEVFIDHGLEESDGAVFAFGDDLHVLNDFAEDFFRNSREGFSGADLDGLSVSDEGIGLHIDFVAAEGDDRAAADGSARNPGNRPDFAVFALGEDFRETEAGFEHAAGGIDLEDEEIGTGGDLAFHLAMKELFVHGVDHPLDLDEGDLEIGAGGVLISGGVRSEAIMSEELPGVVEEIGGEDIEFAAGGSEEEGIAASGLEGASILDDGFFGGEAFDFGGIDDAGFKSGGIRLIGPETNPEDFLIAIHESFDEGLGEERIATLRDETEGKGLGIGIDRPAAAEITKTGLRGHDDFVASEGDESVDASEVGGDPGNGPNLGDIGGEEFGEVADIAVAAEAILYLEDEDGLRALFLRPFPEIESDAGDSGEGFGGNGSLELQELADGWGFGAAKIRPEDEKEQSEKKSEPEGRDGVIP